MTDEHPTDERPDDPRAGQPATPRRALDQGGGSLESTGEPTAAARLVDAWKATRTAPADTLTHGFHTYPARMHPALAAHLIDAYVDDAGPGPVPNVLDPFCGSGTVLVECVARRLPALGVDLNPLAARLSRLKTQLRPAEARERFLAQAEAVTAASIAHVRARDNLRAPLPRSEVLWYEPHVLRELAGLWYEIGKTAPAEDREALTLVFSALLIKFSKQRADTSEIAVDKRLRKGLVSEFFLRKARELTERWAALAERAAQAGRRPDPGAPRILAGDARAVDTLVGKRRFDLILTSPPYGGTYDYVQHQARRYPWLGIDPARFEEHEIGARRRVAEQDDGLLTWNRDLAEVLVALRPIATRRAQLVLLMGDAKSGGQVLPADQQLRELAPACGWTFVASASESRVDWHGGALRREHLVLFTV